MKIIFSKMHGCGNDFVVLDHPPIHYTEMGRIAQKVLDRRLGVGGDQMLVLLPSSKADSRMLVFENNGHESEMCGNGIRCAARYLAEHNAIKSEFCFETLAGLKKVTMESFERIQVNMGKPLFSPHQIPLNDHEEVWGKEFVVDHQRIKLYCVSMGNPHVVVFVEERELLFSQVTRVGPILEKYDLFPNRTNVEFVFIQDQKNILLRVWERNAGETYACGTGACASAVACLREQKTTTPVTVHLKGGDLEISWKSGDDVYMTGPATQVFEGVFEL